MYIVSTLSHYLVSICPSAQHLTSTCPSAASDGGTLPAVATRNCRSVLRIRSSTTCFTGFQQQVCTNCSPALSLSGFTSPGSDASHKGGEAMCVLEGNV